MTTYTAPPNQLNLHLGAADTLTVNASGLADNTSLSGGTLTLNGGEAFTTTLESALFNINAGTAVVTSIFLAVRSISRAAQRSIQMLFRDSLTSMVARPLKQLLNPKAH